MSVSRKPEAVNVDNEVDRFGELWVQTHHAVFELSMSNLPNDGKIGPFSLIQAQPLNGKLKHWQVAELVELNVDSVQLYIAEEDNVGTTPGSVRCEFEVQQEGLNGETFSPPAGDVPENNINNTSTGATEADLIQADSYSEQGPAAHRLWFGGLNATSAFNDTVAGTGGGADGSEMVNTDTVNYRDQYGRGPIFDGQDKLGCHGTLKWDEVANQTIVYSVRYRTYWDIFEYERGQLKEVTGDPFEK